MQRGSKNELRDMRGRTGASQRLILRATTFSAKGNRRNCTARRAASAPCAPSCTTCGRARGISSCVCCMLYVVRCMLYIAALSCVVNVVCVLFLLLFLARMHRCVCALLCVECGMHRRQAPESEHNAASRATFACAQIQTTNGMARGSSSCVCCMLYVVCCVLCVCCLLLRCRLSCTPRVRKRACC